MIALHLGVCAAVIHLGVCAAVILLIVATVSHDPDDWSSP